MSEAMTEEQIKHMANRFLGWPLPADFRPDNGISVKRPNYAPGVQWEPTGTNLFDARQAEEMVRYMVEGMPQAERSPAPVTSEAVVARATAACMGMRGKTVTMEDRMRAALLAALPTPEEHDRGIAAAAEAYREKTGEPGSATLRRNDDSDRRLCAAISAYLAAVGLAP